jgi:protein-arginine kinase activator protein McsA
VSEFSEVDPGDRPLMQYGRELLSRFLVSPERNGICPYCGTTFHQFLDSGVLGCPLCYDALEVPFTT